MASIDSDNIQSLLTWRQKLDEELRQLRTQRDELNTQIARKEVQARNLRQLLESEGYVAKGEKDGVERSNGSVADVAYRTIRDIGQPLYYKEVADRLLEAGVPIPGRDPKANLLSYMVRDQRFQRIGRGTYALTEWGLRPKRSKKKHSRNQKTKASKSRR